MLRIQRKRTSGWRMPPNTVYVGRPTVWGNPYDVREMGLSESLRRYELWLDEMIKNNPDFLKPLYGKDLACWCPLTKPCHVDVLIKIMEREEVQREVQRIAMKHHLRFLPNSGRAQTFYLFEKGLGPAEIVNRNLLPGLKKVTIHSYYSEWTRRRVVE